MDERRNGVGVILKKEYVKSVLGMTRLADRVMTMKLGNESMMMNVVIAYALQVGCEMEEKNNSAVTWMKWRRVYSSSYYYIVSIVCYCIISIAADFTWHFAEGHRCNEVMGWYGVKERNVDGQMVLDFAKRMKAPKNQIMKQLTGVQTYGV